MLNRFNTKSKKYDGLSKIFEMKDSNDKDRSKCLEFNFGGISQIGRIKDSDYVYIRPVLRISK